MFTQLLVFASTALAAAQGPPPPPVLLTVTKSGVDPIVPTPFPGVETIEGAITYDGPPVPGFTGLFTPMLRSTFRLLTVATKVLEVTRPSKATFLPQATKLCYPAPTSMI